jgi:FKBP-type peptidyl-prolyl cis-trans isomerase SlpA
MTAHEPTTRALNTSAPVSTLTPHSMAAPAVVTADSFLTLHYRITLIQAGELLGDFLNTFDDKPATLLMGQGQLAPALEAALVGLTQGTRTTIDFGPGQAFGERNAELLQRVSLKLLHAEAELGTQFEVGDLVSFSAAQGRMAGTIVSFDEHAALMDFNHPLAGQAVAFEVQLIAVL